MNEALMKKVAHHFKLIESKALASFHRFVKTIHSLKFAYQFGGWWFDPSSFFHENNLLEKKNMDT